MCNVPRFWEKVYAGVHEKINSASPAMKKIFLDAIETGRKYNLEYKNKGIPAPCSLKLKFQFYNKTVFTLLKKVLGIERGRFFPVAGAPLSDTINEFLQSVNIPIAYGYGLSETTATVCFYPEIGQLGHEFGAVTGRKRRCGWIDLVALKYAVMINGVSQLIMMKSDVLDTFDTIKACVAYKMNGVETNEFPYEIDDTIEPVYVELPGWKTDMTKMQSEDEFPEEFNAYLSFLEEELGVPVKIVSVGPDREQTIVRYTEE